MADSAYFSRGGEALPGLGSRLRGVCLPQWLGQLKTSRSATGLSAPRRFPSQQVYSINTRNSFV